MLRLVQEHPPDWLVNVGNSGKVLALFDKSQQVRSNRAVHPANKKEELLVYTYTLGVSRKTTAQDTVTLDMRSMLDENEVLAFGLDDWITGQFSVICVQAKNLTVYVIDFLKKVVLRTLKDAGTVLNKSLFRRRREKYFA